MTPKQKCPKYSKGKMSRLLDNYYLGGKSYEKGSTRHERNGEI